MKKIVFLLALLTLIYSPVFAEGPAVSAVNGKVDITGGSLDGEDAFVGSGSLSAPLGEFFGLQLDAAKGEIDSDDVQGGAVHLFMRDPQLYLLGATALYAELDDVEMQRYGAEAEAYMGLFTLAVAGGQQTGDVDDSIYASLDLRYYPLDNLMVEVGGSIADTDDGKAHIGAEYQLMEGLAVYGDLATGEDNYEHALAGIRYYFGTEKSLLKRHREDDPLNKVLASVISAYGSFRPTASTSPSPADESAPIDL